MSINICPMVALAAELTNVPLWLCIPFACLLLCIAIIPLVKGEWWEKYRPFAVIFWSLLFIIPFAVKYGAGTAAETVLEKVGPESMFHRILNMTNLRPWPFSKTIFSLAN